MIPALDSCIGPMSIASLDHSPFHLHTNCVIVTCFKKRYTSCYTLDSITIISHRPSHPMYFCHILLCIFMVFFLFLFDLKFTKMCLPSGPGFRWSVISIESVSFLWLRGLYTQKLYWLRVMNRLEIKLKNK